jgi:hypothetical protein
MLFHYGIRARAIKDWWSRIDYRRGCNATTA